MVFFGHRLQQIMVLFDQFTPRPDSFRFHNGFQIALIGGGEFRLTAIQFHHFVDGSKAVQNGQGRGRQALGLALAFDPGDEGGKIGSVIGVGC